MQVKAEVVEGWFGAVGREFAAVQQEIERDLKPRSFEFAESLRLELTVDITRESRRVHNVLAYLPGRTQEYVVVGAHYDHLGTGEQYSLSPNEAGTVHPGADDNASGTAGVLAIARWLARQPRAERGVLFMAFAGEELGLLGSTHYINNPRRPLQGAVAMINMDMIGRMKEKRVIAGGVASGEGFSQLLNEASKRHQIEIDTSERAVYGSSDHTSFKARMIPVLFFFTGLHSDYHRPSDTWDKIEARNTADLVALIAGVTDQLRRRGDRPRFVGLPGRPSNESVPTVRSGDVGVDGKGLQKSPHSPPAGSR
jgi:Zn-dependent M28 family amino/carboxypeptidase